MSASNNQMDRHRRTSSVCSSSNAGAPPSVRRRVTFSLVMALGAGAFAAWVQANFHVRASDFAQLWWAAHAWLSGTNPYDAVGPEPWRLFQWLPLLYPLPAVVVATPFSLVPLDVAEAIFASVGVGWLTWTLTRDRLLPPSLWLLGSFAMITALQTIQWSPALIAAALTPSFGWLLLAKPSIGLPLLVAYPSRRAVIGCVVAGSLSMVIWPWWLPQWLAIVRTTSAHITAPITEPGGFLLALAGLRWRRADARLLLALACVPHTPALYDALPLCLLITCAEEGMILWAAAFVCRAAIDRLLPPEPTMAVMFAINAKLITWLIYLPCLIMVLRRPNVGWTWSRHTAPPPVLANQ